MKSEIKKICIAAMILALAVIAIKPLSINPGFSFVKISFGPTLIIFSSLYLGPAYGLVVGAGTDLLGALLFPTGDYQPMFTIVYGLVGVLPYIINYLLKKQKNNRFAGVFYNVSLLALLVIIISLVFAFPLIDNLVLKIIYACVAAAVAVLMILVSHQLAKYFSKRNPDYDNKFYYYGIVCIFTEIICLILLNSLAKTIYYDQPYLLMVETMGLIAFINIPLNTFGVYYLDLLLQKIIK